MRNSIARQIIDAYEEPQLTMADIIAEVGWSKDKHYFAEAEHPRYGKVIMLRYGPSVEIECLSKRHGSYQAYWLLSEELVPTGERYTLTKVQE